VPHSHRKHRKCLPLFFISLLFPILLNSNSFSERINRPVPLSVPSEAPLISQEEAILENISFLALYTVEKGKMRCLYYRKEDLRPGQDLVVNGYVSGVVVLSNQEVEACIGNMPMSRIRENEDGTLTCRHFGPLDSMGAIFPYIQSIPQRKPAEIEQTRTSSSKYLFGGYSYFPKVLGAGVSPEEGVFISLKKGEASVQILVRQRKDCTIFKFQPDTSEEIPFRYQGTTLTHHFPVEGELRQRLIAVSEGIRSVENRFEVDLVSRVNLLDYEEIHNAVTCKGEKEIWFYLKALREEPLDELRTIAEHETLHLLVDLKGFADEGELREHFADLKGFGMFSYERFMLITRGILREGQQSLNKDAIFFAFLSERNFLEGMKGGHAHHNPDEFCTSFLHSLMFLEQLTPNLDRPLALQNHRKPHLLTPKEKQNVLKDYIKTLDILARSVSPEKEAFKCFEKICSILQQAHFQAKRDLRMLEGLQTVGGSKAGISGGSRPFL
jgi:hypothetical protein